MIAGALAAIASPAGRVLAGILAALALAALIHAHGVRQGRAAVEAQISAAVIAERDRQAAANEAAAAEATETIRHLRERQVALETQLRENDDAAQRDPDAARACLSADGVRRLDRIR